ncbi:hypothetical protein [Reichenbachiella sp.]|uniref:hypothetical protein n=1 Tax=Reichenbachiella sp. TaxID=2184521 RepID=UPI003B59D324
MSRLKYILFTALCVVSLGDLFAQYSTVGLDLDGDMAAWYDAAIGPGKSPILEGTFYKLEYTALDETPYFKGAHWAKGELQFNGQSYKGVSLLYNSFKDLLLIRNSALQYSSIQSTLLNQQKVDGFTIHKRQFVHLKDSLVPSYGDGFYEKFYEGDTIQFFIKRIKNEYVRSSKVEFLDEDKYFLFDGHKYVKYAGKNSLYKTFPDLKSSLKSYGSSLKTKLKRGEEEGMLQLLIHCDKLLMEK